MTYKLSNLNIVARWLTGTHVNLLMQPSVFKLQCTVVHIKHFMHLDFSFIIDC